MINSMNMLNKIDIVGVIGAGIMGAGIAQIAATAGHKVQLFDIAEGAADKAIVGIGKIYTRLVEKGRLTQDDADTALSNLSSAPSLEGLSKCALIIEAAAERLDIKQTIFKTLEDCCSSETILASNTSSISINSIANGMQHPERILGMHFFNPAPLMALVEVISGLETTPELAEKIFNTAEFWGKSPVYAKSTPGFIVNRVARPFYAEALALLNEQTCPPETIDVIIRSCGGFRMGPLELMDLIGHDTNYAVTSSVFEAYYNDPRFKPSLIQKALVDSGRLGRKSGQGFYDYREGAIKPDVQIEAPCSAPEKINVSGDLGPASNLLDLFNISPVDVEILGGGKENLIHLSDGTRLMLTNGKMATELASDIDGGVICFDLCRDYVASDHIAIAKSDGCSDQGLSDAIGLFQAIGKKVCLIDDAPGLIMARTMAMLANEAADAVHQDVAHASAVDTAMRKGVNYPIGPLEWADKVGVSYVWTVLSNLAKHYGDSRYRPSPFIHRIVLGKGAFHD
jgi:3-hydroxybutyryl-CoA dehydrogenase